MQKSVFLRPLAGMFLLAAAFSQEAPDTTIRITVNLVQVDAVVSDAKGKQVTDLQAGDFEILQDGKPQKITHFAYINTAAIPKPAAPAPAPAQVADKRAPAPPIPVARLKANQVRRTIALVVDDLGLSFESIAQVRSNLKKFVDQQVEPGDLVAIMRTGAGMGALQSFTTDKRELYAAIDRVKFNAIGRVGVSSFAPLGSAEAADAATNAMEFRDSAFTVGTLGAIRFIADGLKELPGRKSVIIFSENMKLFNADGMDQMVMDSLRQLTDLCNRASVVLYTIDPRGLPTLSLTAEDRPDARRPDRLAQQQMERHTQYWDSQEGLNYLAQETGGLFIHDTNDIGKGLREVMDDQLGYYLIGYTPDSATFDEKTGRRLFHKVAIKVKRPGLHVRTRNGFFGVPDSGAPTMPRTRDGELQYALSSPFGASGIHLRLTGLFFTGAKPAAGAKNAPPVKAPPKGKVPPGAKNAPPTITPGGPVITTMLHIDGRDLTFVDEPDGWHKTVIDILAMTFGDNGVDVDSSNRTYTIRLHGKEYENALENGFVYTIPHPVRKPGAYQLRMAVRDATSEKVGSASQYIEVPDVSKGHLTLSGILVQANPLAPPKPAASAAPPAAGANPPAAAANPPAGAPEHAAAATAAQTEGRQQGDPSESPAVRIFKPGHAMIYAYYVINAQTEHGKKAELQAQLRLFHDGKLAYEGKVQPLTADDQPDMKRIFAGGRLQLGSKMTPGDYVLQVVVTDNLAKDKYRVATNAMDFEVRN